MVKFRSFFCLYLVSFSTLFSSSSKIFLLVSPPPHSFFLYSFFLYSFFLLLFLLSPSSALPSWTLKASSSTYRCTWWLIDQTLFLSSPMKFAPTSACSTSAWTHVLDLVLDPCLGSLLGAFDFDFDFMVVVAAAVTAIAENHLLVLVMRVGVSVRGEVEERGEVARCRCHHVGF